MNMFNITKVTFAVILLIVLCTIHILIKKTGNVASLWFFGYIFFYFCFCFYTYLTCDKWDTKVTIKTNDGYAYKIKTYSFNPLTSKVDGYCHEKSKWYELDKNNNDLVISCELAFSSAFVYLILLLYIISYFAYFLNIAFNNHHY